MGFHTSREEMKKEVAFLKKSSAKNFCYARAGSFAHPRPRIKKSFSSEKEGIACQA
jgi:hypothetical protein